MFIWKMVTATIGFIALNGYNATKYVSMRNQRCKITPTIVNINSNEPILYPYSVTVNKCSGIFVMILIISIVNYVLLIKWKTRISKYYM